MLIGLISIFLAGGLAYYEFRGAERFCSDIDGKYNLEVFPLPSTHYCNKQPITQYNDGWDFERVILGKVNISLP